MPDQKLRISEPRTNELQVFDDFAVRPQHAKNFTGLPSTSLYDESREFNRVSTVLEAKQSLGGRSGHSTAKGRNRVLTIAPGLRKPASSLKTAGSGPSRRVQPARAVVRPHVETTGEEKLERKKKKSAEAFFQSPPSEEDVKVEIVHTHAASINPPTKYRGVRERPGVNGFLVEIRPTRWKRTIWLGTYKTGPEAARAYDAGIFYTGKDIPFNFQESKDSFSPLPEHLSLDDSNPQVMDQVIHFVKQKALEASKRGNVEPKKGSSEVPQTGKKKFDHNIINSSCSVGVQTCTSPAEGLSSDKKSSLHVQDEDYGSSDFVNPIPFENLEPLPGNLPHYSSTKQDLNLGDDQRDCWGRICPSVHDYLPQTSILEDEDLYITEQTSNLTDKVMVPDQTSSFQSILGSENDGDLGNPATSKLGLWGLPLPSCGPGVWDPASLGSGYGLPRSFLNVEAWPQAKNLHDSSFAMTQFKPEDVLLLHRNGQDASFMSVCMGSVEEPDDDEEFSVSLWQ